MSPNICYIDDLSTCPNEIHGARAFLSQKTGFCNGNPAGCTHNATAQEPRPLQVKSIPDHSKLRHKVKQNMTQHRSLRDSYRGILFQ